RIWSLLTDERSRKVVEVAEQYADGVVSEQELDVTAEAAAAAVEAARNDSRADENNESAFVLAVGCFAALEAAYNYGRRYVYGRYRDFCFHGGAYAAAGRAAYQSALSTHQIAEAAESGECAAQCRLLRDIFSNPFRSSVLDRIWLTADVVRLARTA